MESVLEQIIENMPPWFFIWAGILILLAVTIFFGLVLIGARRLSGIFSAILKRDAKIEQLYEKNDELHRQRDQLESKASQLYTSGMSILSILEAFNDLCQTHHVMVKHHDILSLLQRCLDSLASDLKAHAGDIHR